MPRCARHDRIPRYAREREPMFPTLRQNGRKGGPARSGIGTRCPTETQGLSTRTRFVFASSLEMTFEPDYEESVRRSFRRLSGAFRRSSIAAWVLFQIGTARTSNRRPLGVNVIRR